MAPQKQSGLIENDAPLMHHCKPGMIGSIPRASMVPAQPVTWQGIDISTREAAVQALLSEGRKELASIRAMLRS